ncbi:MAG: iron ABC transporter permease [Pseudomonadota bacterium]
MLFAIPVITIFVHLFYPQTDIWQHLTNTVLGNYVSNSIILVIGVSIGTFLLGVPSAWFCTMYNFPGRRIFAWALLLPLAMPAYIIAYTYSGLMDYSGPIQSNLRQWFEWGVGDYWFPSIHNVYGAIIFLSLVLYPYVYLLSRAAFLEQSPSLIEASRSLGANAFKNFFRVGITMGRPAIIGGIALAVMETLADYGTVQYFGVSTFTTGIFRTWFGFGDSNAAAHLAAMLMVAVFVFFLLERWSRKKARYTDKARGRRGLLRESLGKKTSLLVFCLCFFTVFFGFILPAGQLLYWSFLTAGSMVNKDFFVITANTLLLAAITSVITLVLALIMIYGKRLSQSLLSDIMLRIVSIGYVLPGTVIAIGILIPFAWFDNYLNKVIVTSFDSNIGLLLSGSIFILIFSYCTRFLAVSIHTIDASIEKISMNIDNAARSLGRSSASVLMKIHTPLMRSSLLTALLVVFVEVMKELPATLILRPFNFNTLAVRAYELASDERLADSSTAAIMIVVAGIIPVIILSQNISKRFGQNEQKT